jgi:ankyrin repeat protein
LEVLEILLQKPSANVDTPRSTFLSAGKTPLRTAAARGRYEICERLLEASATVNLMIDGQTALDSAIDNGHKDVCRLMLEHGAKVDPMLDQKMSILARAVYSDRLMICQLLLDHGADINDSDFKKTKLRRTALMQAAAQNNVRITRWLLDHGAKVDGPEPDISTPLVEAARANAINACQILLESNAARFLKSGKGTAVETATGWLKKCIGEWPASRSWKLPEGTSAPTVMRDPLGVHRQG